MSATVSIFGNLGCAPETRITPAGNFVANFSFASNSVLRSPQGNVEKTDWFRITAFGNHAKTLAKYAKKGTRLVIQGNLSTGAWLNREGVPQVNADVLLHDFQFTGDRDRTESNTASDPDQAETVDNEVAASGDQALESEVAKVAEPTGEIPELSYDHEISQEIRQELSPEVSPEITQEITDQTLCY